MKTDGVETAYGLLSNILSEITLNDLPPTNENPAIKASSPLVTPQVGTIKGNHDSSHRPGSTKYSRQIHKSTDATSPATAHTSPTTPTNSTPSSVSTRYRSLPISPSTESSFSTSSNYSLGKSGSFEEMAPKFISPDEEQAFCKAKSISTMGNVSLATYMFNTLNKSYEFRTDALHEQFQQPMEVLQRIQNPSNPSSYSHSQVVRSQHHTMMHPNHSKQTQVNGTNWNRHRLNSKSTYSPTTSGQTSESGSHASISSKNSLSTGEVWTSEKVDALTNDLRNLTVNTLSEFGGDSTEDYDYHHEAIMNEDGDVYLSEESDDEEERDKQNQPNQNLNEETLNTPKKEIDISDQPTPLMGLNLRKDSSMKTSTRKPTHINTLPPPLNTQSNVNANKRIQMFGSEYARFLSSTVLSPAIPRKKKTIMQSLSRIKENKTPQKSNTSSNPSSLPPSSSSNVHYRSRFLEDAPHAILTGPVTDMVITLGNELPPRGFYRISLSAQGHKADLTNNSGGTSLFLNVKKESNWDRAAQRPSVTAMAVIFPDRGEVVPPGFCFVRRIKEKQIGKRSKHTDSRTMASQSFRAAQDATVPANLNFGTNGERIYLCFKKSREGNPITGIIPLLPGKLEAIPDGFTVLERSPRNFVADVNSGAGSPIFLGYRQRLTNLETLRPKPLLQIHSQRLLDPSEALNGYFCTGGTVVKSQVGDLHIMDRSTHTMLSPSSVTNRLSLIHQSRDGTEGFDVVKLQKKKPRRRTSPAPPKPTKRYSPSPTPSTKSNASYNVSFVDGNIEMADVDTTENLFTSQNECAVRQKNIRTLTWKEFRNTNDDESGNLVAFDFIPFVTDGTGDILCEPARIEVITPILTACYTQHGGSALLAVEGLQKLLNESDFFEEDIREGERDEHCLTLLDLSVQVVCDVATSSSRETHFKPCVDFVSGATRFARGNLGPRTFGYVLRFYLFVFYFGANVAPSSCWPHNMRLEDYSQKASKKNFDVDVPLLSEIEDSAIGAPQSSALCLKEMISLILKRLGENTMIDEDALITEKRKEDSIHDFVENLILGMISNSAKRVDVNNITELAIHQIHRSGGSELFWYDMVSSCGFELFGDSGTYSLAFGILSNLVKVGSGYMRRVKETQELVPRDVATKLLTLEMVLHFLDRASISIGDRVDASSDHHRSSNELNYINTKQQQDKKVLSYTIRRLVVPLVLSNTTAGLEDPRVFRRLLKIVAKLWSCFRTHLKVEIAVLFEHFLLRVLRLGPKVRAFSNRIPMEQTNHRVYLDHQLDVLSEVELWVENPIDLLELFLNYDMGDASSATHWKACQHICGALCKLAEQCGEIIAEQINCSRVNNETNSSNTVAAPISQMENVEELAQTRDAARSLQEKSLDVICHIVRLIMDASYRAYTKQKRKDNPVGRRLLSDGSWESNESLLNSDVTPYGLHPYQSIEPEGMHDYADDMSDASFSSADTSPSPMRRSKKSSPTREINRTKPGSPQRVTHFAPSIASSQTSINRLKPPIIEKPPRHPPRKNSNSVFRSPIQLTRHKSKVDELTEDQKRTQEALQVAFEIIETKNNGLKKGLDYLIACNFLLPGPRDVASFLRIHKQRIDPAVLGEYLGEGGHAGDGEFWKLVRYHYIRATSFVGMNVEYGLRSFLTKSGFRLPGEAQKVDRLISTFAQCFWEDNVGDHTTCPFQHRDSVFIVAFAVIILNTDLHRAGATSGGTGGGSSKRKERKKMTREDFLKILRDAEDCKNLSKVYVYSIYDSIAAYPIELHDIQGRNSNIPTEDFKANNTLPTDWFAISSDTHLNSTKTFVANVKPALELLRGLAIHEQTFVTARDDESALSCEFLRRVFKSLWHHFYGIINASLDAVQLDPQSIGSCLSVLRYAISTTIYLDMSVERNAFIAQLARIKYLKERGLEDGARIGLSQQETNYIKKEQFKKEAWYDDLKDLSASTGNASNANERAVKKINILTRELCRAMQIDSHLNQTMHKVTRRIRNGEILLSDPTRSFIREGDLLKRCNRSGRYVLYRFFLFSDVLIYTHKSSNRGDYKIHAELPLYLMKISSVPSRKGDKKKYCFQIHHPKKSFLVCAPTAERKTRWMEDIAAVMSGSLDRKAGVHGARIGSVPKNMSHS